MTTTSQGTDVRDTLVITSTELIPTVDEPRQLPLMWSVPNEPVTPPEPKPWSRAAAAATWLDIARMLPANLAVEFTAEHGWRIVHLPATARRSLELLDIYEGDVIPDAARREAARRRAVAEDQLAQAIAVLRAVNVEQQARWTRRSA